MAGLLESHQLRYVHTESGVDGKLRAGLFFLSGQVSSERTLEFAWERGKEIFVTTLPISCFEFVVEWTFGTPTAMFVFSDEFLAETALDRHAVLAGNPNQVLKKARDCGALSVSIKISKADFEKEIYLLLFSFVTVSWLNDSKTSHVRTFAVKD